MSIMLFKCLNNSLLLCMQHKCYLNYDTIAVIATTDIGPKLNFLRNAFVKQQTMAAAHHTVHTRWQVSVKTVSQRYCVTGLQLHQFHYLLVSKDHGIVCENYCRYRVVLKKPMGNYSWLSTLDLKSHHQTMTPASSDNDASLKAVRNVIAA